ncbi:L-serine ammonia-lyase, iron-sulfur-dependent, subunit alpha [Desulfovibrio inopinatus]|uniref:L-serine ammonia-lyase, iron-sulfur-dependent, subunit alpha n=1 Tax=Desulfovibrio inopinatus TaxID=102109 RepID=UPI000400D5C8|nr:L-serine ammonia-lyase, iron-sulfur-dependent, subunit alpha [Desulfovibrio inopinatus]
MGFQIQDILHGKAKSLIHLETDPGLGCTEPAAIGLAAASAASLLHNPPENIVLTTDPNLHRNAMGVVIPNSGGRTSIALAAAMGAMAGDPAKRLQVFASIEQDGLDKALALVAAGGVTVEIDRAQEALFVKVVITAKDQQATCLIEGRHDNIVSLTLNGEAVTDSPLLSAQTADGPEPLTELESWLMSLSLDSMIDLLDDLDEDDFAYMRQGLHLNMALAEYGLKHGPGLGVGRTQLSLMRQGLLHEDMPLHAGTVAAAGIDSRMGGVSLSAMTLAGSGNQGIAASTPIAAASEFMTIEDEALIYKALTLSAMVTCLVKARVGRLSAICGSAIAGGAGVAAGVCYLLGGTTQKIGGAITNHIENTSTLICDGAKTSCALKVGDAASSAVKSALLALNGVIVSPIDGIVGRSGEESIANLGTLSAKGMQGMTPAILDIMLAKCP